MTNNGVVAMTGMATSGGKVMIITGTAITALDIARPG
jgi:hypothetical protein